MKAYVFAIAGANGSDLFGAGTYKFSDKTLKVNGRPAKLKSLVARATMEITSGKYTDSAGREQSLDLSLLTTALEAGELVTFQYALHEIITAAAPAMFYFE